MNERIELYLVGILRGLLPGETVVPMEGGDDEENSTEVNPPFVLCKVTSCENVADDPPTYQVGAKIAYFSQTDDTSVQAHNEAFERLKGAVEKLPKGYYASTGITINGTNGGGTEEKRDDDQRIRGSVVVLSMGVTDGRVG